MEDWKRVARRLLRNEMDKRAVRFKKLSSLLESQGVTLEVVPLTNKVNRGTFSFIFFLQCMRALDVDVIRLFDKELEAAKEMTG